MKNRPDFELMNLGIQIQVHMHTTKAEQRAGSKEFPKKFGWKKMPVMWCKVTEAGTVCATVYYRLTK